MLQKVKKVLDYSSIPLLLTALALLLLFTLFDFIALCASPTSFNYYVSKEPYKFAAIVVNLATCIPGLVISIIGTIYTYNKRIDKAMTCGYWSLVSSSTGYSIASILRIVNYSLNMEKISSSFGMLIVNETLNLVLIFGCLLVLLISYGDTSTKFKLVMRSLGFFLFALYSIVGFSAGISSGIAFVYVLFLIDLFTGIFSMWIKPEEKQEQVEKEGSEELEVNNSENN